MTFVGPYPWQATIADSPNGAAPAYFSTTLIGDDNGVLPRSAVVGRDGSYRLHSVTDLRELDQLSPDGKILAAAGELVDLATNRRSSLTTEPDAAYCDDLFRILVCRGVSRFGL